VQTCTQSSYHSHHCHAINATNITGQSATTATHILLVALLLSLELNGFSAAAAGAGTIGAFETGIDFKSARSVRLKSRQTKAQKLVNTNTTTAAAAAAASATNSTTHTWP
jgi:hypothetical protein